MSEANTSSTEPTPAKPAWPRPPIRTPHPDDCGHNHTSEAEAEACEEEGGHVPTDLLPTDRPAGPSYAARQLGAHWERWYDSDASYKADTQDQLREGLRFMSIVQLDSVTPEQWGILVEEVYHIAHEVDPVADLPAQAQWFIDQLVVWGAYEPDDDCPTCGEPGQYCLGHGDLPDDEEYVGRDGVALDPPVVINRIDPTAGMHATNDVRTATTAYHIGLRLARLSGSMAGFEQLIAPVQALLAAKSLTSGEVWETGDVETTLTLALRVVSDTTVMVAAYGVQA